jgi:hypothetical protein
MKSELNVYIMSQPRLALQLLQATRTSKSRASSLPMAVTYFFVTVKNMVPEKSVGTFMITFLHSFTYLVQYSTTYCKKMNYKCKLCLPAMLSFHILQNITLKK